MTEQELIATVLETAGKTEQQIPRFRILGVLKPALQLLGDQVASSGDRELRSQIRKTFGPTASDADGRLSLQSFLDDPEPLILKHLNTAEIYLDGVLRRLTLLPDESAVRLDRPAGFPFGTLIGTDLLVFNGGQPFEGNVTVRAAYAPTLANVPTRSLLGERLITITRELVVGRQPTPTRTAAQELKTVAAEGK